MRILILGGTGFIGREIAATLLQAGHSVTVLARGRTSGGLPPAIEQLRGDRDAGVVGLEALEGRSWDACVDLSGYFPRQVQTSAEMLRANLGRYIFVSAVSVYGDPQDRPVYEAHPRMPPAGEEITEINSETYGPLKVACENCVRQTYGARCAILRPQIVVGPHDARGRYAYWVRRALHGGEMLAPGDGSDHLQVIDVRDIARFAQIVIERELMGDFNLAGPRFTWMEFMKLLGAERVAWVPAEIIRAAGLTEFEMPLYRTERGPRSGLMEVANEKALSAGLTITDPKETLRHIQAGVRAQNLPPPLGLDRDAELIRLAR